MDPVLPNRAPRPKPAPSHERSPELASGQTSDPAPASSGHAIAPLDPVLALLRQDGCDLNGLERMLMAWAVHPHGPGFDRALLMAWDPAREMLVGRLYWMPEPSPSEPGASIQRAQRMASEGPAPERTRELRRSTLRFDQLPEVAREAWARGTFALGPITDGGEPGILSGRDAGAVVLKKGGSPVALIVGDWDASGDASQRQKGLDHLHALATTALDAQAARGETSRRARQAAAMSELVRASVSARNLAEILAATTRLAVQATGARGGAIWTRGESGALTLRATEGSPASRERFARALGPLAALAVEQARPVFRERLVDELRLSPEIAAQIQSLVVVPLMAYDRVVGVLGVYDCESSHPADMPMFDVADREFLGTLADVAALAHDQAERCEALRSAESRQRDLQRRLARSERLAELGETAARVAQEVRNPLASIGAFARRVLRDLGPQDPGRAHLEIVIRESERLERLVGEQLQLATVQPARLKLESLNRVVQEALQAEGERLVRRRVRLIKKLAPDLPALLLDAVRIRRVVGSVLENALESVAPGGRVRVESRRSGAWVVVEIANDGPRMPGDVMELLFVPFALSRSGGAGLGLAAAHQILKEHGGEMRVRSESEWSTVYSVTIPIPSNQDRRHPGPGRRGARPDRRERHPSA